VDRASLKRSDSFFGNEKESKAEQSCARGVFFDTDRARSLAIMMKVQALLPRISERQSEVVREKLSDYIATLLEKNAVRLSRYDKVHARPDVRTK
jgi:hypothetical protein